MERVTKRKHHNTGSSGNVGVIVLYTFTILAIIFILFYIVFKNYAH